MATEGIQPFCRQDTGTMMPWVTRRLLLLYVYRFVFSLLSLQTLSIRIPNEQVIAADKNIIALLPLVWAVLGSRTFRSSKLGGHRNRKCKCLNWVTRRDGQWGHSFHPSNSLSCFLPGGSTESCFLLHQSTVTESGTMQH